MSETERIRMIGQLSNMGIPKDTAQRALKFYDWNLNRAADGLFSGTFQDSKGNDDKTRGRDRQQGHSHGGAHVPPNPVQGRAVVVHPEVGTAAASGGSDTDLNRAIQLSLQEEKRKKQAEEYNLMDLQLPDQSLPRGLKNLGNTCFVNCLMQIYFYLTPIRDRMLKMEGSENEIVKNFQELFANLLYTEKRYYNPRPLLMNMEKEKILSKVGIQEDINEVNEKLLTHLEEADEELKKFLKDTFYGNFVTTIQSKEEDGTPIDLKRKEPFNHLHINIDQDQPSLYESLNMLTTTESIDYKTEKDYKTTAKRTTFIENAPPVILFQLKRSFFNKDIGMTMKINKAYEFPDYVYLDRYFEENREEILKRRNRVEKFKSEIRVLRDRLKKFEFEGQDGSSLVANVLSFLKKIERGQGDVENGLVKIHDEVKEHCDSLKGQVKDFDFKIDSIFDDWKKEKYVLHSIVVHEGTTVDMGHYTTYIKYNDYGESEEEEEEHEGEEQEIEEEAEKVEEKAEEVKKTEKVESDKPSEDVTVPASGPKKKEEEEEEEEEKDKKKKSILSTIKNTLTPRKKKTEKKKKKKKKKVFRWAKFNDKNVTLMNELEVYENLKVGNRSVYCLLYLREEYKNALTPPSKPISQEYEDDNTPITSPTNMPNPIDFGINAFLRMKVLDENAKFKLELEKHMEKEKIEIEKEKKRFVAQFEEILGKTSRRFDRLTTTERRYPTEVLTCTTDLRVSSMPCFVSLLLGGTKNDMVHFECAKFAYGKVIEKKRVNTFEKMLKLVKVKQPEEEEMKKVRNAREEFLNVTRHIAAAIDALNRVNYNLNEAITCLRKAMAFDHKQQVFQLKQWDIIVQYLAVCMKQMFETGISLLRSSRTNCHEYFDTFARNVPLVLTHPHFREHLKNVCGRFFDVCHMVENTHTFEEQDCKFMNARVITTFQKLYVPKESGITDRQETPLQVPFVDLNMTLYRSMKDGNFGGYMKRVMEQVNKKYFDSVRGFRYPNDARYRSTFFNNRRNFNDFVDYFKPNDRRNISFQQREHHNFWRGNTGGGDGRDGNWGSHMS